MMSRTKVHKTIGGFKPLEFAEDSRYAVDAVSHGFKFGIIKKCGKILVSPRRFQRKGFFGSGVPYFLTNYLLGREVYVHNAKRKYFED